MNQFFTEQVLTKKFDGFLECLKKIQAIQIASMEGALLSNTNL